MSEIMVETTVHAPVETVWQCWTEPFHIRQWNAASPEWHTPSASNDLRAGGTFSYRMEARDGSAGFDFAGQYTRVVPQQLIEMTLDDGRKARVEFLAAHEGVTVREVFEVEDTHSAEQQRQGWQAILDNFARHVQQCKT
ncbi:MAG: SRPBCC family protein [Brachymonas sp.]|nr:SRPBCC family protein [Brachymonas sp.]